TAVKMNACATVGRVWPTFKVPGIIRSGTSLSARKAAVDVANDPMPSASRKLVTAPIRTSVSVGPFSDFDQPTTYVPVSTARAASNALMGFEREAANAEIAFIEALAYNKRLSLIVACA